MTQGTRQGMTIQVAGPEIADWDELMTLRLDIERWLVTRGITQWAYTPVQLSELARYFDRNEVFMLRRADGRLAGSMALTRDFDHEYWPDKERGEYLYLEKVMTAPELRRRGAGAVLVAYAQSVARDKHLRGLRLDCLASSPRLRTTWERLGFTCLRTVASPLGDERMLLERTLAMTGDSISGD